MNDDMVFTPAGPDSTAQVLNQCVENVLRNLDHFGRCLVGLLVLQQIGRFFIQIDA
jgi:hypothetical protein